MLAAIAAATLLLATSEPQALATRLAALNGAEWEGFAGGGGVRVPIRGSVLTRTREGEHQFSLVDTVGEGDDAITAAMVVTFRWDEKADEYRGTIDEILPGGKSADHLAPLRGTFKRGVLTLRTEGSDFVLGGAKGAKQVVFDFSDEDAERFRLEIIRPGKEPFFVIGGKFKPPAGPR